MSYPRLCRISEIESGPETIEISDSPPVVVVGRSQAQATVVFDSQVRPQTIGRYGREGEDVCVCVCACGCVRRACLYVVLVTLENANFFFFLSRKHATLSLNTASKAIVFTDLGSLNGSYVNGKRVEVHQRKRVARGADKSVVRPPFDLGASFASRRRQAAVWATGAGVCV